MIPVRRLSTRVLDGSAPSLGVLSIHLDGQRCRVGCEFCYLGARVEGQAAAPDLELFEDALTRLRYDELAVAVSEPIEAWRPALARLVAVAARRGVPVAVTTTLQIAAAAPEIFDGVARVNLSVDPRKGGVDARRVAAAVAPFAGALDVVLIVSLTTPEFAARLVDDGLLEALVDLDAVDKVALNALKPPPPWCDRAFWLRTLARLGPLLDRALDRKLFLDCYVAARILGIGGCPARADLSPAPAPSGLAFRSCVYQPAPDFTVADAGELEARLAHFVAPPVCPFPIV